MGQGVQFSAIHQSQELIERRQTTVWLVSVYRYLLINEICSAPYSYPLRTTLVIIIIISWVIARILKRNFSTFHSCNWCNWGFTFFFKLINCFIRPVLMMLRDIVNLLEYFGGSSVKIVSHLFHAEFNEEQLGLFFLPISLIVFEIFETNVHRSGRKFSTRLDI